MVKELMHNNLGLLKQAKQAVRTSLKAYSMTSIKIRKIFDIKKLNLTQYVNYMQLME